MDLFNKRMSEFIKSNYEFYRKLCNGEKVDMKEIERMFLENYMLMVIIKDIVIDVKKDY